MKTIVKNILILVLMLAWSNAEAMNQETKKPAQHVPALNLAPAHALQQDAAWDTVLKSLKKKQYPIVTLQEIFNAACATSATKARAVLETIRDYQFIERAYSKLEITWCGWLLDVFNHAVSHKQWKLIHLLITTYDYRESTLTELYPTVQSQLEKIQTRRNKKQFVNMMKKMRNICKQYKKQFYNNVRVLTI